jgi:hypothetical protein
MRDLLSMTTSMMPPARRRYRGEPAYWPGFRSNFSLHPGEQK